MLNVHRKLNTNITPVANIESSSKNKTTDQPLKDVANTTNDYINGYKSAEGKYMNQKAWNQYFVDRLGEIGLLVISQFKAMNDLYNRVEKIEEKVQKPELITDMFVKSVNK